MTMCLNHPNTNAAAVKRGGITVHLIGSHGEFYDGAIVCIPENCVAHIVLDSHHFEVDDSPSLNSRTPPSISSIITPSSSSESPSPSSEHDRQAVFRVPFDALFLPGNALTHTLPHQQNNTHHHNNHHNNHHRHDQFGDVGAPIKAEQLAIGCRVEVWQRINHEQGVGSFAYPLAEQQRPIENASAENEERNGEREVNLVGMSNESRPSFAWFPARVEKLLGEVVAVQLETSRNKEAVELHEIRLAPNATAPAHTHNNKRDNHRQRIPLTAQLLMTHEIAIPPQLMDMCLDSYDFHADLRKWLGSDFVCHLQANKPENGENVATSSASQAASEGQGGRLQIVGVGRECVRAAAMLGEPYLRQLSQKRNLWNRRRERERNRERDAQLVVQQFYVPTHLVALTVGRKFVNVEAARKRPGIRFVEQVQVSATTATGATVSNGREAGGGGVTAIRIGGDSEEAVTEARRELEMRRRIRFVHESFVTRLIGKKSAMREEIMRATKLVNMRIIVWNQVIDQLDTGSNDNLFDLGDPTDWPDEVRAFLNQFNDTASNQNDETTVNQKEDGKEGDGDAVADLQKNKQSPSKKQTKCITDWGAQDDEDSPSPETNQQQQQAIAESCPPPHRREAPPYFCVELLGSVRAVDDAIIYVAFLEDSWTELDALANQHDTLSTRLSRINSRNSTTNGDGDGNGSGGGQSQLSSSRSSSTHSLSQARRTPQTIKNQTHTASSSYLPRHSQQQHFQNEQPMRARGRPGSRSELVQSQNKFRMSNNSMQHQSQYQQQQQPIRTQSRYQQQNRPPLPHHYATGSGAAAAANYAPQNNQYAHWQQQYGHQYASYQEHQHQQQNFGATNQYRPLSQQQRRKNQYHQDYYATQRNQNLNHDQYRSASGARGGRGISNGYRNGNGNNGAANQSSAMGNHKEHHIPQKSNQNAQEN